MEIQRWFENSRILAGDTPAQCAAMSPIAFESSTSSTAAREAEKSCVWLATNTRRDETSDSEVELKGVSAATTESRNSKVSCGEGGKRTKFQ